VARKALKTISFREEQEKLNVWVALLNLENLYGTPEVLEKTLQEAVQLNDASKLYTQMLKIFSDTNKIDVIFSFKVLDILLSFVKYRKETRSLIRCCVNSELTRTLGYKEEISISKPIKLKKEDICYSELFEAWKTRIVSR